MITVSFLIGFFTFATALAITDAWASITAFLIMLFVVGLIVYFYSDPNRNDDICSQCSGRRTKFLGIPGMNPCAAIFVIILATIVIVGLTAFISTYSAEAGVLALIFMILFSCLIAVGLSAWLIDCEYRRQEKQRVNEKSTGHLTFDTPE